MGQQQSNYSEEASKKYPHYKSYMECQSKAFVVGQISLISGAAVIFLGQEVVKKYIPMSLGMRVATPILGGSVIAYIITRQRTKMCQNMWMAMEEKHSALSDKTILNMDGDVSKSS